MHVHHVGMLRSWASWSKVMREHLVALDDAGHGISWRETDDDRYDPGFPLPEPLASIPEEPPADADAVTMTYLPPSEYADLPDDRPLAGFLAYEATRWPPDWIAEAREHLDVAVVASSFNYRGLVDSGLPADQVVVVPHGFDADTYRPGSDDADDDPFRVLFVGTPSRRKGLDVLVDAIADAFDPGDDVEIVLKVTPYDGEMLERSYVIGDWRARCERLADAGHDIRRVHESLSEAEMAALYRDADVFCIPTRGEGFGNTTLEAMACGTAPIVTGWSGPTDFVTDDAGFLLSDYEFVPADDRYLGAPPPASTGAEMVDPSTAEVAATLRHAYENQDLVARKGERAREQVADMTWAGVTETLVETFERELFG